MDALYAELDSVTHLLETQAQGYLSARDLDDITHLIRVSATFRTRLQYHSGQAGPRREELTPIPSRPPHSSSSGPIYTPTAPSYPHRTPIYPQDHHLPLHVHDHPHRCHGDTAVSPPASDSLAPDFRGAGRCSVHPTFLSIIYRPLIGLVGPTKGRNFTSTSGQFGEQSHP